MRRLVYTWRCDGQPHAAVRLRARISRHVTTTPLELQSATELSAKLQCGDISAVDLIDACARRYELHNPTVNAVVAARYDAAREEARRADERIARGEPIGPLHGLPIALKDVTDTAGVRTTYGSRQFRDHVPTDDAVLAQRLKEAGAIL